MDTRTIIDTAWHPLAGGCPPEWANAWGQDRYGVWVEFTLESITQRLRWVPPGRFRMGSPESERAGFPENERHWFDREGPQHVVTISQGFWLFDTACTQALWEAVMGENPSRFQSPDRPVEQVNWSQVRDFMAQINARLPGLELVLPTEAQWEYACRAGTQTATYAGDLEILGERNAPVLDPIAWYGGNSGMDFELKQGHDSSGWPKKQYPHQRAGTHPVGRKRPNPWGLYDMLGNVWEWCQDGLREYRDETETDPFGPMEPSAERMVRGGAWSRHARNVRAASRHQFHPDYRNIFLGFRCARVQA